jgi:hypothetical protein
VEDGKNGKSAATAAAKRAPVRKRLNRDDVFTPEELEGELGVVNKFVSEMKHCRASVRLVM